MRTSTRDFLMAGALALSLIAGGCAGDTGDIIGGDRDKQGCLTGAGYSYSKDIGACVREWEIDDEGKERAAKEAVDYVIDNGMERYALTVADIKVLRCVGCYDVYLEQEGDNTLVRLRDWEANSSGPYDPPGAGEP